MTAPKKKDPPYNKEKVDAKAKEARERKNPKQEAKNRAKRKTRNAESRRPAHKAVATKQGKVAPPKTESK